MFTPQERQMASQIVNTPEMVLLLKKIFMPDRSAIRKDLESTITDDAQYGRTMKALVLAETMNERAFETLTKLGATKSTKQTPVAPM